MGGKYRIEIETRAKGELFDLPKEIVRRIAAAFADLENNPRPPGAKKLTAQEGYRIRIGDYRILYSIDDKEHCLKIYRIAHRREVYR